MIVEVTGTGTANKGAELMLAAIRVHCCDTLPDVKLAVTPHFGPYDRRAHYGLLQKVTWKKWGRSRLGFSLLPPGFRAAYGMVTEDQVGAVFDAAGFAFGDQHEASRTVHFADDVTRWKRAGKKVVLLPQALGPFEQPVIREAFKRVVDQADLIYARDPISFEYVQGLSGTSKHLRLAPDFTNLVKPAEPMQQSEEVLIVPNHRMVEKTGDAAGAYLPFLARCVEAIESRGATWGLLLHDDRIDRQLVDPFKQLLGRDFPVHSANDPIALKAMLGGAQLVIGSRFHALVGALSQAVPTIASGWSHKYEMLFEDYACPEMVLPIDAALDRIGQALEVGLGASRNQQVESLRMKAGEQLSRVRQMWSEVDELLAP
jgi:polysaccharide pyruvyl transferase WcaK-like protein